MLVFILFLIIILFFVKWGGADAATVNFRAPMVVIKTPPDCEIKHLPPYCRTQFYTGDTLPDYDAALKRKMREFNYFGFNKLKFSSYINQIYSYVYSAIRFLEKNRMNAKIILIDSEIGFTANILAQYFPNEIIYFTPKKTIKLNKKIKHIRRLPGPADFKKYADNILISYVLLSFNEGADYYKEVNNSHNCQIYYQNYLLSGFKPKCYSMLYVLSTANNVPMPYGKYVLPPFAFPGISILIEQDFIWLSLPQIKIENVEDLKIRIIIFILCTRNMVSAGENWDTSRTRPILKKYPLIKKILGDIPAKGAAFCQKLMPNTGNEDIISGTEKKIIQRSVFVENYHNVAKIINYRDIDLLPAINIYNGVVRENRMLTVRRALEKISGSKGFFNNVEYFREMAVYGHHYYDKIPEEVKKIADSAEMKVFTGLPENYNTIIPENFDHPAIVRELCKIIKSMKIKAEKIYIDACEPMVKAFLKTYPKIKITVIGWVNVVHKNIKKQNINAVDFLKTDTLYWQLF